MATQKPSQSLLRTRTACRCRTASFFPWHLKGGAWELTCFSALGDCFRPLLGMWPASESAGFLAHLLDTHVHERFP